MSHPPDLPLCAPRRPSPAMVPRVFLTPWGSRAASQDKEQVIAPHADAADRMVARVRSFGIRPSRGLRCARVGGRVEGVARVDARNSELLRDI